MPAVEGMGGEHPHLHSWGYGGNTCVTAGRHLHPTAGGGGARAPPLRKARKGTNMPTAVWGGHPHGHWGWGGTHILHIVA